MTDSSIAIRDALRRVVIDARLKKLSSEINTDVGSSKSYKTEVKAKYNNSCLFCGSTVNLTVAHLIAHNSKEDYSAYGPPTYSSPIDLSSIRNRIVLCGTKTGRGTCHNLFDHHNVMLLFNPFENVYKLRCVSEGNDNFAVGNTYDISFPAHMRDEDRPYKRALAWRAKKCVLENAHRVTANFLDDVVNLADLSEAEEMAPLTAGDDTTGTEATA